jgi:hypothetical protein
MEDVHVLMQGLTKWNSAKVSDIMRTLRRTERAYEQAARPGDV